MHPNKLTGGNIVKSTITGKTFTTTFTMQEHVHPNCMVFNENGRLFVGDSRGHISVWDIALRQGNIYADNYFKIR